MTPTIRRARLDEAAALTALSLRSKASNGYDAAFMAACVEELTVTPDRMREGDYWVAERDGALCGCVCLAGGAHAGEIHAFFIDPKFQRSGIGSALWQTVRAEAVERGLQTLALDADPKVVPFYEAMGFEVVGENPSGSIPGRLLPKMAVSLTNT